MKKLSLCLFAICIFQCVAITVDHKYFFQNINISNGLSQNTVNAILQDKKGYMWFGTKDGLNRYDGRNFREYKYNVAKHGCLGNNFITKLFEDSEGNIWVGTDAGLYLYYPERDVFERFLIKSDKNTQITRTVSMITSDNAGQIWVTVEAQGLFCYNLKTHKSTNYTLKELANVSTNLECISFDDNGGIWLGFYGDGLYYSNDKLKNVNPYKTSDNKEEVFKNDPISRIVKGAYNFYYVCSIKGGLKEINITSGKIRDLLLVDENGENIFCRDLIVSSERELWVATETGIYIYDLKTNKYTHLHHSQDDSYSLSDNAIYAIYKDCDGGMWVGSYFGGVDYYPKQYTFFEKYYPKRDNSGLSGKRVREFCADTDGTLWIGTEDGGLNHFNPANGEFTFFAPSANFTNIHGLCVDGDDLWVGTFSKGLKRVNKRTGNVVKDYMRGYSIHSYDNSVFSICKTSSGSIYIGTSYGLHVYNRAKDDFEPIRELKGRFIYDIKEDSYGNIWAATYAHGVFRFNISTQKWENYVFNENDKSSLPYNKVLSVFEDSHRQIWLTTQGRGFCKFDFKTRKFERHNSQDGLPNDVVYQIVEDDNGLFWLTTNSGLVQFDVAKNTYKIFTTADGLICNQFNYRSSFKDAKGDIYFGSINGFIKFNPKKFIENKHVPSVVITDFYLFNREVLASDNNSPLNKNISYSDEIVLDYDQNSFSFRLAALGGNLSEHNKIEYKLKNFDSEWQSTVENPMITYSNLPYGNYEFRARACNRDGVGNEEELVLHIKISPPFYLSVWAKMLYLIVFLVSVFYTIVYFKKRSAMRHQRQLEKFEQEKEREIYNSKIDFFTNVAHEIRTPLTLIKGPLENIILKKDLDAEIREDLNIMEHNTERLLTLTNELLDFRKIEAKGYQLNFVKCDIRELLQSTFHRFTSLARQKGIEFTLDVPELAFYAHVNKEALTKIISNLLNNAVKYSDSIIKVSLTVGTEVQNTFELKVENDGSVIPLEIRENIFQPFIRVNRGDNMTTTTGTGIGLALARSLAELHQGTLVMNNDITSNIFILTLPVLQELTIDLEQKDKYPNFNLDKSITIDSKVEEYNNLKKKILLVEDNIDMIAFEVKQFTQDYTVLTAHNGKEALAILNDHYVSIVITDIVMPEMNGFELCEIIKSNVEYSHIPVIMLTAKTNIQSKIDGMELGADAYIEKPFSVEYLKVNVANLITNREKLKQAFAQSPFVSANTMVTTTADDKFMKKLDEIIHLNLHNPDFSMDDIADAMNMSRSNFYRKIKGVLDLSPNEYLRIERLKEAARLLKEGEIRVTEICYRVGFNSPSYFSKCFQKQFGTLPKDF